MILEHYSGTIRILILAEIIVLKIQFHDEKKLANANINRRIKYLPRKICLKIGMEGKQCYF